MSDPDARINKVDNSDGRLSGVQASIFKAYDVRGIYPDEINRENANKIGFAVVRFLQACSASLGQAKSPGKKINIVVGEDCRISSPALREAVVDAITKAGANVEYIGFCTTPLFYFSVNKLNADGGIMVTASHNPPQYGGLKIVSSESRPIGAESGLKDIERISSGALEMERELGIVREVKLIDDYIDFLIKESKISRGTNKLKVVVDAGNGMTPLVLRPLFEKLKFDYISLYFEIDCNFPNHSPDISKVEALNDLKKKVIEMKADLGVAFDGDGDRIFLVDERGNIIRSEYLLALLYEDSVSFFYKPKAVYDIRVSRSIKELLGSRGFKSRPGHSFIKQVMRDNNADVGGELSGHFFFKRMKFAESSILAMLKVMRIISDSGKNISGLIKPYQKYYHSGEINIEIGDREAGTAIVQKLKVIYKEGKLDETDGITVNYPDWWFNVRLSNTEPLVRLVVEADTEELMGKKVQELNTEIKKTA